MKSRAFSICYTAQIALLLHCHKIHCNDTLASCNLLRILRNCKTCNSVIAMHLVAMQNASGLRNCFQLVEWVSFGLTLYIDSYKCHHDKILQIRHFLLLLKILNKICVLGCHIPPKSWVEYVGTCFFCFCFLAQVACVFHA